MNIQNSDHVKIYRPRTIATQDDLSIVDGHYEWLEGLEIFCLTIARHSPYFEATPKTDRPQHRMSSRNSNRPA